MSSEPLLINMNLMNIDLLIYKEIEEPATSILTEGIGWAQFYLVWVVQWDFHGGGLPGFVLTFHRMHK